MEIKKVETEVLCVGGGIAALMGAIRAAECGARVVVADKGNTLTSGAGGAGNDHFLCYIPEVHGDDVGHVIRSALNGQMGGIIRTFGPTQAVKWFKKSFDIVKLWDEWGIPMKPYGEWRFAGHAFPGQTRTMLKYHGKYQKKVLTREAHRRGVNIMNRTMVIDLLGDENGVTGAVAVDTRENRLTEFRAKSVIMATGLIRRLYPGPAPMVMNNDTHPLNLTAEGRVMAYRLGAKLFNIDMLVRQIAIKGFVRAGQGSWVGVYRAPDGKPLGKYVSKPNVDTGDILPEVDNKVFTDTLESGKGPVYMDCTGISDEVLEFMKTGLTHEGCEALVDYFQKEGINPQKHPLEFKSLGLVGAGGLIWHDENAATSVRGLYSAGDCAGRGISCAATFGWYAGENAAQYSKDDSASINETDSQSKVEEKRELIEGILKRKSGYDWKDANIALLQTMEEYAGLVTSADMLDAGLKHLKRLKAKVDSSLVATNQWELTRCLEVIDLYNMAELIFLAALDRKESRGFRQRIDYPYSDPLLLGKMQITRQVGGKPVIEWSRVPHAL